VESQHGGPTQVDCFFDMLSCFMISSFLFFLQLFPEVDGDIAPQGGLRLIVVFCPSFFLNPF